MPISEERGPDTAVHAGSQEVTKSKTGRRIRHPRPLGLLRWFALVMLLHGLCGSRLLAATPLVDDLDAGLTGDFQTTVALPDGGLLVGGSLVAQGETFSRGVVLLNSLGKRDTNFHGPPGGPVVALAPLRDGTVLAGGLFKFDSDDGATHTNLVRLKGDGSVDSSFKTWTDNIVMSIHVMRDGRVLIGGQFQSVNGLPRACLARLLPDGHVDPTFVPTEAIGYISSLDTLADGTVFAAGDFNTLGEPRVSRLARYHADGNLDISFAPEVGGGLVAMSLHPNGSLMIGGFFQSIGNLQQPLLARVFGDGTPDPSFRPAVEGPVFTLGWLANGRIAAGGAFGSVGGQPYGRMAMFLDSGAVDPTFAPDFDQQVLSLVPQGDGRIAASGWFRTVGGKARTGVARLNAPVPGEQALEIRDGNLSWTLSGGAALLSRATFDYSEDGFTWTSMGEGSATGDWAKGEPQRWTVKADAVPTNAMVRGYGVYSCGIYNGSQSLTTIAGGPPTTIQQPQDRTVLPGTDVTFSADIRGVGPISYRWYKDGVPMNDDSRISGTTTAALKIAKTQIEDEGGYTVWAYNALGAINSLAAVLTILDPSINSHPTGGWVNSGESITLTVGAGGTAPIYRWLHDGIPIPGAEAPSLVIQATGPSEAGSYEAVVANDHASITSKVAEVFVNLASVSPSFRPALTGEVVTFIVDPAGRIIASRGAAVSGGVSSPPMLTRVLTDGAVDTAWSVPVDIAPTSMAMREDGSLVVGGDFSTLGGVPRRRIGRILADASVDPDFHPALDGAVNAVVPLPGGALLVAGAFGTVDGVRKQSLVRFQPNGALDPGFTITADGAVSNALVQADGRIVISGRFQRINDSPRPLLARINADGSLDEAFNVPVTGTISTLALQTDGSILVGGLFTSLGGSPRKNLGRLNSDGTLDSGFAPQPSAAVTALVIRADGTIVVAGGFQQIAGLKHSLLAQLNPDGTADNSFRMDVTSPVTGLGLSPDGTLWVSGNFAQIGGVTVSRLAAVLVPGIGLPALSLQDSTLRWIWPSKGPMPGTPRFSYSLDRLNWILLDPPTAPSSPQPSAVRVWELSSKALPAAASIRAEAQLRGGRLSTSAWRLDQYLGTPVILATASGTTTTNIAGSARLLGVTASGSEPLTYQWWMNGTQMTQGPSPFPSLTLSNLLKANEGIYSVVVSNAQGSTTGVVARVLVVDPYLKSSPTNVAAEVGGRALFSVEVAGTDLRYTWLHEGEIIPGAQSASLAIDPVAASSAGSYLAVASNQFGSVTSTVASLAVNLAPADPGFRTSVTGIVLSVTIQTDGHLLVGGRGVLYSENGESGGPLCRLSDDGRLANDASTHVLIDSDVAAMTSMPDGGMLIGGLFTSVNEQAWPRLARLLNDGTVDETFNATVNAVAQDAIYAMLPLPDGGFLLGGRFKSIAGLARSSIARIDAAGRVDTNFVAAVEYNSPRAVRCLALQPDGKILVGGTFLSINGLRQPYLARLNPDGSLDSSFRPNVSDGVLTLVVQRDSSILVGGPFRTLNGQPRAGFARLLQPAGAVDTGFDAALTGTTTPSVSAICVQSDGQVLLGGVFSQSHGLPRSNIVRLLPSGETDPSFFPTAPISVTTLALDATGSLFAGGVTSVPSDRGASLLKFSASSAPTESFRVEADTIFWTRSGPSPDFWRATVEFDSGQGVWTAPGKGNATSNGWTFALPAGSSATRARLRGFVNGGNPSSSAWYLERVLTLRGEAAPRIVTDDGLLGVKNGHMTFTVGGEFGQVIVIERSASLTDWVPLRTNAMNAATATFRDESPAGTGPAFYRLRLLR